MKRCLADINVWLALLAGQHIHHKQARQWFDELSAGEGGLCRIVQLALIRLLGTRSIMGEDVVSAAEAWKLIGELLEDERVDFVVEPFDLDAVFPTLLRYPVPTGKLVTDAYLAAFAICTSRKLVSFDRGFRQFRGMELELLPL